MNPLSLSLMQSNSLVFHRKIQTVKSKELRLLERTLFLEENSIRVTLHPTCRYLQNLIDHDSVLCYLEDEKIQEAGERIMKTKVHCASKYNQMSKAYEEFDTYVENSDIKCDCVNGCSRCCYDLFYVSENEFLYLLATMIQKGKLYKLANIYRKAKRQEGFLKENEPYLSELIACHFTAQSKEFYNLGETYAVPETCPFLDDDGRCLHYQARPNICRLYGTTRPCEVSGSIGRKGIEQVLLQNGVLKVQSNVYVKQYRPIFYFAVHMLAPVQIRKTLQLVKNFISLPEEEYFAKLDRRDWFLYATM